MEKALKVLGILVAGVLVVVVVAYLAIAGAAVLDARANKQDAVSEAEQAIPGARDATLAQHDRLRAAAGDRAATWSWLEITCGWVTRDAGWIVSTYVQDCRLQAVDLVPAAPLAGTNCAEREISLRQRNEITSSIVVGPTASLAREWTHEFDCPNDLVLHEYDDARVVLDGERPDDLDDAPAWTMLRTTTPLTSTDVGCHRWSVLFCDQPGDVELPEQ